MTAELMKRADQVMANTYQRYPVVFIKGNGAKLWDTEGRSYTDFVAGIAVCNLGHAHPRIYEALAQQAQTLLHVSNLYYTRPQIELASWLVENSFADRVFFGNSGAEANEAAIKLARKYFKERGEDNRFRIVAMERSFHGALRSQIGPSTCAVMLEPIQGEGGVRCPDENYLKAVRQICNETGTLLIFDEIQTGMGRTGRLFAYQHFGVEPDIMTLAKALANGLPIGAMLARENIAAAFGIGSHASTFGGTPVVTAAALEACKILVEDNIIENARSVGQYFKEKLHDLQTRHPIIEEVRGLGLLLGMQLKIDGRPLVTQCMQNGFLINCIQEKILRFIPPLIISTEEIDQLVACLDQILSQAEAS
jgi:acetylornithine/N-succinyldiaminopimelate aminotransferase